MRVTKLTLCVIVILFVSSVLRTPVSVNAQSEIMAPTEVSLKGEIIDNYVNVSYELIFDNTASSSAKEIEWQFELRDDIRLSNVSLKLGDLTYWGHAVEEQQAIETYEEYVESNQTAVLVVQTFEGYLVSLNVESGIQAELKVFVEGLLTRTLGYYSLSLPISPSSSVNSEFNVDIMIDSHYGVIDSYYIRGLSGFDVTNLGGGIHIEYSATTFLPTEITFGYALERQTGGSELLTYLNGTDKFFVYMLAPTIIEESESAQRQYVFVLDKSGSMSGTKMDQAKIAFNSMINDLQPGDLFNIIAFSETIYSMWAEPHGVSTSSLDEAQDWVNNLQAGGSTNFHGAALEGLSTFTETDNVKVMLFLSDGLPTAGVTTNPTIIMNDILEANTLNISISTIAFGNDADGTLMTNIASQNSGYFALIQPGDDASTEILDFYQLFGTPLADVYEISIEGAVDIACLSPLCNSPFFNGTEVVISGRFSGTLNIDTTINYASGEESYYNSAHFVSGDYPYVELIWAQHRINHLLKMVQQEGDSDTLRRDIVKIALGYGIIVEGYTALILTVEETPEETPTETTTTWDPGYVPPPATTYYPPPATYTATPQPAADFSISPMIIGLIAGIGAGVVCLIISGLVAKSIRSRS